MDYWNEVDWKVVDTLEECLREPFYFFSSKAKTSYSDTTYTRDAQLIFGSETRGLPTAYFEKWPEHFRTIPMRSGVRCINLSSATSIVLYEAWRQLSFSFPV